MTWLSFFLFFKIQRVRSPTNSRCPRRWRYEGTTWICRFVKKTLRYPVVPLRVKYICAVYIHINQLLDPYGKYPNVLLKLDIALAEFAVSKCVVTTTHPNYLWCIHRLYIYIYTTFPLLGCTSHFWYWWITNVFSRMISYELSHYNHLALLLVGKSLYTRQQSHHYIGCQ